MNINIPIEKYERDMMDWFVTGWEEVSSCSCHKHCSYHDDPKYEYARDHMNNDNPFRQIFYDEWLDDNWEDYANEEDDTKETVAARFPLK